MSEVIDTIPQSKLRNPLFNAIWSLDPSRNPVGLVGPDGVVVYEYDAASRRFFYHTQISRRSLSELVTASNTPASRTEIYIDFNRGADGNAGTRFAPKKNLSVLSGATYSAGSVIALANDSRWDLDIYAGAAYINADNIRSADSNNPVIITGYDPAGYSGLKPIISMYWKIPSGGWSWDAAYNAWVYSFTTWSPTVNVASVFFGDGKTQGVNCWQGALPTNQPLPSVNTVFGVQTDYATVRKVYVWAPEATNPEAYYGSVYIANPFRGVFNSGWQGLRNTVFDGIEVACGAPLVRVNPSAGAGAHTGLVVKRCKAYAAELLEFLSDETATHTFSAFDNEGVDVPTSFMRTQSPSGFVDFDIYRNRVNSCNLQNSAMAAFYIQSDASALGNAKCHHNYVRDAKNGVGTELGGSYGSEFDGCGYYADLGSSNNVFFGNIAELCHVGFQSNSAGVVQFISNAAIDCNIFSTHTNAGLTTGNDITVGHNTFVNRLTTPIEHGWASPDTVCISNWTDSGAGVTAVRVFNNALWRATPAEGTAITVANEASSQLVRGNFLYGWSDSTYLARSRTINGSTDTDITATAVVSDTVGGWFDGGEIRPSISSILRRAGHLYIDNLKDLSGVTFEKMPTVGALEYQD